MTYDLGVGVSPACYINTTRYDLPPCNAYASSDLTGSRTRSLNPATWEKPLGDVVRFIRRVFRWEGVPSSQRTHTPMLRFVSGLPTRVQVV